ncbi:MAG: 5'-methylthioadenosine phosphorylase [Bacteriovoracaceae bacterium]|jgi:5'-methylthioadenosine phosphorylase
MIFWHCGRNESNRVKGAKMSEIGIIGGSGVYALEGIKIVNEHEVQTPFGNPSDKIIEAELNGIKVYFLPRHGRNHSVLPHEVNYRANIFALKKLGVEYLISVSAVGSLKEELPPKTFVTPDNFIDWTKGKRDRTFFGNGIVAHVSTAYPVEEKLRKIIHNCCVSADIKCSDGGSYICIEGPQFSSRAESEIYRGFGASVIGMTNVPESYLAKEAGMAYATMAMVTDYDCWKEEHCAIDEILLVMGENNKNANKVLPSIITSLNENKFEVNKENRIGIMTPIESLNAAQREIVEVLVK